MVNDESDPDETAPEARSRARFPRTRYGLSTSDFRRIYGKGSRARGSLMTVVVHDNGLDHPRLGLSVGKRCWKSAVRRNRVRRVFREAFRLTLAELPEGVDLVLIASTPGLKPELASTRHELVGMANKALRRYEEKEGLARRPS